MCLREGENEPHNPCKLVCIFLLRFFHYLGLGIVGCFQSYMYMYLSKHVILTSACHLRKKVHGIALLVLKIKFMTDIAGRFAPWALSLGVRRGAVPSVMAL